MHIWKPLLDRVNKICNTNSELPAGGYLAEITMFTYRTALLVHIYCVYNESPLTIQAHDDRLAKENRKLPLGIQQMFLL
jgi:hypothetical protein